MTASPSEDPGRPASAPGTTAHDRQDPRVVVTVPTFRRNQQLQRLLSTLIEQCEPIGASVVVIDNDPLGGAATAVRTYVGPTVSYVHEPAPGLSAVRNRALTAAEGADVLVFIDDDCLPGPGWLSELVQHWVAWGCTAVTGPVRWELEVDSPWAQASGAFDRARRPTGTAVHGAATNNLLLDVTAITELGLRFDEQFGLSGGEDTMFTHLLIDRGGTIRWSDGAEIREPVPRSRATRHWVVRRTFRAGTTWSRMRLALAGSGHRRLQERIGLMARGMLRVIAGSARLAFGTTRRSLRDRARGSCLAASGLGMVLGAVGYLHLEYARPDAGPSRSGRCDAADPKYVGVTSLS